MKKNEREYERNAILAKWVGALSQVEPKKHPTVDKMMGKKQDRRAMSGREIGAVMRALKSRMH